jgi:hypothetical protein
MTIQSREVQKRLSVLPQRKRLDGPRNGAHLTPEGREAGDAFYRCAVEIAKYVYTKIDARYLPTGTASVAREHCTKMEDARKILNEARNDVFEAVLPLFTVTRATTDDKIGRGDVVATDYIVRNVFDMMVRTYKAWSDHFVTSEQVEEMDRSIDKIASVQRERLEQWLGNFKFTPIDLSIKDR